MYIKNTRLCKQGRAAPLLSCLSRSPALKNSLVAPALIAIFVRGILAKFSHLQNRTEGGRPSSMYTSPFFLPPCFISKNVPLSLREMLRAASETQRLVWTFPSLSLLGMILLNLLLSFCSAVPYCPRRRHCCLGTERGTRHCSLYRRQIYGNDIELSTISPAKQIEPLYFVLYVSYKKIDKLHSLN